MILTFILFKNKKGVTGSGVDEGKKYISFVRGNMDQIDKKITDDLWALSAIEVIFLSFFQNPSEEFLDKYLSLYIEFYIKFLCLFRNGMPNKFNVLVLG